MPKALGMVYTQEGKGKDILLLHGWGANKEYFYYQKEHLKKRFRVTTVDFWGFGESDKLSAPYSVFDYAVRLECFLELINLKPYAILAHSFGARIVLKMTAFPEKLIITGGAGIKPKRSLKYYLKVGTYKFLKSLRLFDREKLRKTFSAPGYAELDEIMRGTFSIVTKEDLTPYLKEVTSRTLLVWGENDAETPLYMARKMEREIRGSAVVVMENAGHFPFIDNPRLFNSILDNFL